MTRLERICDRWNTRHPIGTPVVVKRDGGQTISTRTRSAAQVLGGHTAVIWVEGISGCYALDRVSALRAETQR